MPYVSSGGGLPLYYELRGSGPPLVLLHGMTQSGADWAEDGYAALLEPYWTLILVDARGHGRSGKPHDPAAYSAALHAADVVAVLDQLDYAAAAFWGYSMGGRVGFALGARYADRLEALVIGGACPQAAHRGYLEAAVAALAGGTSALADQLEAAGMRSVGWRTRLVQGDAQALQAAHRALAEDPSLEPELRDFSMPVAIYCGTRDSNHNDARRAADTVPNGRFCSLPELDHIQVLQAPELVTPWVHAFLSEATRP